MTGCEDGQADVLITHAMIEAGVYEARTFPLGGDLAELVRNVFTAMVLEQESRP